MSFKNKILALNPYLKYVPSGFKRYDNVIILRSPHILPNDLGNTILNLFPWCETVFQHKTTEGEDRQPKLVKLAGSGSSIVVHKENGVKYCLDLARITFSGGNKGLRQRLINIVKDGEFLLDMFAAVGNLSLQPLFYRNIEAILVEKNDYTFKFLKKSLDLNNLSHILAINQDCRDLEIIEKADRIFMGYHNVGKSHLVKALAVSKKEATIHLHPLAKPKHWNEWVDYYAKIIHQEGAKIIKKSVTKIKNYSPGLEHIEIVLQISK